MLTALLNFVDWLNERVGRIVSIWMIPLICLMTFEVFMRYVFFSPTEWGTELVSYIFAAYILLGGGYTLLYKDHVNINVLYNRQVAPSPGRIGFDHRGALFSLCLGPFL